MLCPKCGYQMQPTDLNCPRCAQFAAAGTPVVATPPAGKAPANPIYVEDPYVRLEAKIELEDRVAYGNFVLFSFSVVFGGLVGFAAFAAIYSLGSTTSLTMGIILLTAFIVGLVVTFYAAKAFYRFVDHKLGGSPRNGKS